MSLLTIYMSVALVVFSMALICTPDSFRQDPSRVAALVVAAALWPVMVIGVVQFGAIRPIAALVHRQTAASMEPLEHLDKLVGFSPKQAA